MNNKGIVLISLIITIIVIIILAAIVISRGIENAPSEERCMNGHYEHDYISISKYDFARGQYYNTAICTRCGHELKVKEDRL